jgi:type IV pilus assembly protein PilX
MRNIQVIRRERGAALVVGMILLLVLTLLAVSGMNTASTELVMAGNEQFQENAFQAAEMGIEQGLANGDFNPGTASEPLYVNVDVPGTAANTDEYTTTITPWPAINSPMPAMWGNRWNSFSTFHFEILSTGVSVRNATTSNTQGMFVIAPFDPGTPPPLTGVVGL